MRVVVVVTVQQPVGVHVKEREEMLLFVSFK